MINAEREDGGACENGGFAYEKREKTRIRREFRTAKILVYDYKVARVKQEPKPKVEPNSFATAPYRASQAHFPLAFQGDRRNLTRPQGAFGYTVNDEGNRTENREVA
jgi:hypothetical protein